MTSVLFWPCLLTAAVLYAGVSLSPRIVAGRDLEVRHALNQQRLEQLSQALERAERVVRSLEAESRVVIRGNRVSVMETDNHEDQPHSTTANVVLADSWFVAVCRELAVVGPVRQRCQGVAIALVFVSFVLLRDREAKRTPNNEHAPLRLTSSHSTQPQ